MRYTILILVLLSCLNSTTAQDTPDQKLLDFSSKVLPLIKSYCLECHSGEDAEGEFDLLEWKADDHALKQIGKLEKFAAMVKSGQMPPKGSPQPTQEGKQLLTDWSRALLFKEAKKYAGDPGPIVLRRLSNAEYDYTIRDLTGLENLSPTKEFPVDGAAGEGFTNTGNAQAMSPALMQKYFDAAKDIARHVTLLPSGITFSPYYSERDRIDHYIRRIQKFYGRYADDTGSSKVNLQGIQFETNGGGRLPLTRYIKATLQYRELQNRELSIEEFARQNALSPKYLQKLWELFQSKNPSPLISQIQQLWNQSNSSDVGKLIDAIGHWQSILWKFNSIGHLGKKNGPRHWMEPNDPQSTLRSIVVTPPESKAEYVYFHLAVLSSSNGSAEVQWIKPRIVDQQNNVILLRDLEYLTQQRIKMRDSLLAKTNRLLTACGRINDKIRSTGKPFSESELETIAKEAGASPIELEAWLNFLGINTGTRVQVSGHFTNQIQNSNGNTSIRGWGSGETPLILASSSDQQFRIPGIMSPKSVVVHPSPTLFSGCVWQSPVTGEIILSADIADSHPECGNGVEWTVNHQSSQRLSKIWQGKIDTGKSSNLVKKKINVRKGDLLSFLVGPRDGNHSCDLTRINLQIEETESKRKWDLAERLSKHVLESNPIGDQFGNEDVWHLVKGNWNDALKRFERSSGVPADSVLDRWLNTADKNAQIGLQKQLVDWLNNTQPQPKPDSPDAILLQQIKELADPLYSKALRPLIKPDARFGKSDSNNSVLPGVDLVTSSGTLTSFKIPADWMRGRKVMVDAKLADPQGSQSVQLFAQFEQPNLTKPHVKTPFTISNNQNAQDALKLSFNEFREYFPVAICYPRIVPVDEVVTLTLFHREDDWLKKLFLSNDEAGELDRLWDEFLFVAQEPMKSLVALEQIYQFATQDRPDLVNEFESLFEPARNRVKEYLDRRKACEELHLKSVYRFAEQAWRLPLAVPTHEKLKDLYQTIRNQQVDHESAIQMLIARILVSPEFLYRRESPGEGVHYSKITDQELAVRLSYFLWSSSPDENLRQVATEGGLSKPEQLDVQLERMLGDPKIRRLAIHFACQWLHLRDFDKNDDKNEKLFPEFERIRSDMYEETVQFFTQLFRDNRSILDIVDSDYVILNATMARHYGLKSDVQADRWQLFPLESRNERGGVLGMATFLASQSGASRTSPILRGTWLSETLLGEKLPRPPANVPQLPETVPTGLTARQLIEQHSSVPACAKCHARIDPYGFALEQFDALGRIRPKKADTNTTLFDGLKIDGFADLKSYISNQRRDDFVRQFCKKLLGFAIGREIQLSDEPLILDMMNKLKKDNYRFRAAVETIIKSDQFLNVRDLDYTR